MDLLYRETLNQGARKVNARNEFIYETDTNNRTVIPYNKDWRRLLIQVSGGLDSALLLYLTARAFKELNLSVEILPFSIEIPTKAKNLASARKVIEVVSGLVGYEKIAKGIEVVMLEEDCKPPRKDAFFDRLLSDMLRNGEVDFEFSGNTKNPPESARSEFPNDHARQLARDARTSVYNADVSASPHAMNDKQGIVYLYQKFGILDSLATHTLSCDMDIAKIEELNLEIPCGRCWWCYERAWGFKANNLEDPALAK